MGLFELFYRMVRLPWAMVAYGLEAFGRAVEDLREIAEGGLDLLGEPPWQEDVAEFAAFAYFAETGFQEQPLKEERRMYVDQDLSGDMVKVVQYAIVSVATNVTDDARIITNPPKVIAFSNDMTGEDFASWIMAINCKSIAEWEEKHPGRPQRDNVPKYFRVAYSVMGRFARADFDYDQVQADALVRIADKIDRYCPIPPSDDAPAAKKS